MKQFVDYLWSKRSVWVSVGVVLAAAAIWAFRVKIFFSMPNFFVEDATVLFDAVYTRNPIGAILHPFNGYLIVGQYLLAYVAAGVNLIFGNHLGNLPVVTAVISCLFLGLVASLPYLLFRKQLGKALALALVLFTALVPMYSYDYAIIGSLSNLKFAFLYIAFLLVLYRQQTLKLWQYVLVDALLLLCVVTNAPSAFLVPFVLLAYIKDWKKYRKFKVTAKNVPVYSALAITGLAGLYVLAAVVRGIPHDPGYLDTPFRLQSLLPFIERNTTYAWAYPITGLFNSYFVTLLCIALTVGGVMVFRRRAHDRFALLFALWAVGISTALLIYTRSGLGDLLQTYGHKGGPDQFFYAQNMIVIFITGWLARDWLRSLARNGRIAVAAAAVLYLAFAIPYGTSFGGSAIVYKEMKPIDYNLAKACREYAKQDKVIIQVYPTPYWQWRVDRHRACE